MTGGMGLDRRRKDIQGLHRLMIAVGIILCHLHRLQLLQTGLLLNLVVALIGIMLEMPDIGDITDIAYLIAQMGEVTEEDIEGDGGTSMAQMGITIYSRTADIHTYMRGMERTKQLFPTRERVIDHQWLINHIFSSYYTAL